MINTLQREELRTRKKLKRCAPLKPRDATVYFWTRYADSRLQQLEEAHAEFEQRDAQRPY